MVFFPFQETCVQIDKFTTPQHGIAQHSIHRTYCEGEEEEKGEINIL